MCFLSPMITSINRLTTHYASILTHATPSICSYVLKVNKLLFLLLSDKVHIYCFSIFGALSSFFVSASNGFASKHRRQDGCRDISFGIRFTASCSDWINRFEQDSLAMGCLVSSILLSTDYLDLCLFVPCFSAFFDLLISLVQ